MEWRCEWCGKPHDEDDPPCDNCGHGSFEKAVVQQPAAASGGSTTVWVCTECGREHPKHSPPCSRCGNANLEREEVRFEDVEVDRVGYRDLLTTRYALGLALVAVLGGVLLLGLAGVVDLPGIGSGVPEVDGVPGDGNEHEGTPLADVEAGYLEQFNEARRGDGASGLRRVDRIDAVARYYNHRRVKAEFGNDTTPTDQRLHDLLGDACGSRVFVITPSVAADSGESTPSETGDAIVRTYTTLGGETTVPGSRTGIDVHAGPHDTLYVTQLVC